MKYGLEVAIQEFASRISNNGLDIHTEFIGYTNSISQEKQLISTESFRNWSTMP
jgi:hypothetical protein